MLAVKEWNLDTMMFKYLWSPFKWMGKKLQFLSFKGITILLVIAGTAFLGLSLYKPDFPAFQTEIISVSLMIVALALILFSFSHRGSALNAWVYLLLAHVFIVAAIGINTLYINTAEIVFYTSGILAAFAIGRYCLLKIKSIDNDILLNQHHGYVYEQKTNAFLFLLAAIGLLGFPVTAAFVGIDVFFTYVQSQQAVLIALLALCFIFIELAAVRIFLRIYLGPHKKLSHPVAFRSS